ncbi:MAG: hypothetical protein ACRDHG_14535 [Anaerolineales bacterium]
MKRTHLSLYYLVGYLIPAGIGLIAAPQIVLRLLLSNGDYGDVMPRLLGVVLLALGIIVLQILRLQAEALYPTTLIARSVILVCLVGIYIYARDPLFISLLGIVGLGFVLTGASYLMDRRSSAR